MTRTTANPFYAARISQAASTSAGDQLAKWSPFDRSDDAVYAKLPRAPVNASPVPSLTSLYHNDETGPYGDRRYPGNCSGGLIRDLLLFYRPERVFDPMEGSGTCKDVCRELGIPCVSADLRYGVDACSAASYPRATRFPFVWVHPPNRATDYHSIRRWAIPLGQPDNCHTGAVGPGRVAGAAPTNRCNRAGIMRTESTTAPPRARVPLRLP